MKKYKEWLTNEIEIMESETSENFPHEQMVEREVVLNLINQLDEPEVLSQKWIEKNTYVNDHIWQEFVYVDDLENLLVPKQEELEVKIQELIEAYKQEEDAYGELENGWISGFVKDLKNLMEEEQKYVIPIDENHALCKFTNVVWGIYKESTDKLYLEDYFKFTEQEIKAYDERFWAFAVPVEVAE